MPLNYGENDVHGVTIGMDNTTYGNDPSDQ